MPRTTRPLPPDLHANNLAGYNDFYPPVLLASFARSIVGNRHVLAEAYGTDAILRQALRDEVFANRSRTLFREPLVEFIAPGTVGVTFDFKIQSRMSEDDARQFGWLFPGGRPDIVLTGVEGHIGHGHK